MLQKIKVDNNYAVVIDGWYTEEEYNIAFKECNFASQYLMNPSKTGSATDSNGNNLKQNKAIFIGELFKDFNRSVIGQFSYKLYQKECIDTLISIDQIYRYLNSCTNHDCLVSYYEESDYYKAHIDNSVITMLTWSYEEPKAFHGGNLILRDKDKNIVAEIECIANRSVLFPSFMLHEVTEIAMDPEDLNQNKGRFTISQFSNISG